MPRPGASGTAHATKRGLTALGLAALGVVFGDIGTSPLYALQATFSPDGGAVSVNPQHVYGVISAVFWSITIIVTCKYVLMVLRADHHGEGGILSLATLVRRHVQAHGRLAMIAGTAGIVGACLFFGDSVITPAISVLSAVEGLRVAAPALPDVVVPIALVILVTLFAVQRWGTAFIGAAFGPIMLVWFVLLAALGVPHIVAHPEILQALNPLHALGFVTERPFAALVALGTIVLVVTGAEALYADLGHFGRRAIQVAWLAVVFPALVLNYLGQGALVLERPEAVANPFFNMAPSWAALPLVVVATVATVIASQSVISGTYSVAVQAMRLGLLPRLEVRHTSARERGQVYLPVVNGVLMVSVIIVVLLFRSSGALAAAYGLAVTATFVVTTLLLLLVARRAWGWPIAVLVPVGIVLLAVELAYLAANSLKFFSGGWLPVLIGSLLFVIMTTWRSGRREVVEQRRWREGALRDFLHHLVDRPPLRVRGTVVYLHSSASSTPLAFRINKRVNGVVHERCIFVRVVTIEAAHVPPEEQITFEPITDGPPGMYRATVHVGFFDRVRLPALLERAAHDAGLTDYRPDDVTYLLTHLQLHPAHARGLGGWRRQLFVWLSRSASSPSDHFGLPPARTVELTAALTV